MSGDGSGGARRRPRPITRPPSMPGALGQLKDLLYELYVQAGRPSLDEIAADIGADDDLPGAPGRDSINRILGLADLPPSQADVVAVAVVLARRARWDPADAATRARERWVSAHLAAARPPAPLGRVIGELGERDALALEVHQAFAAPHTAGAGPVPVLPPYLQREGFDDRLRAAVAAAEHGSRLVMVVGDSSTGKTRACWEAIRAVLPTWRIWHPLTPQRPMAVVQALRGGSVAARSVIWLNEAQDYLQASPAGESVATVLQALLAQESGGPVLVLGSMWPDYWKVLTRRPDQATDSDLHRAARALLGHAETITVPRQFTTRQLTDLAETIAADPRLRTAARRAPGGRITQELAGAPELLRRYRQADPVEQAVLWAAMDARRLGHGPYLTEPLLQRAAPGYLDDDTWDQIGGDEDWFTTAVDRLAAPHRRLPGPLIEHHPRPGEPPFPHPLYRLADYLDQHGRRERALLCPPAAFWDAATRHAHLSADLVALAEAARERGRYRLASRLARQAADAGNTDALLLLAEMREEAGDRPGAERLARRAADVGNIGALVRLAEMWEDEDGQGAERLYRQAADAGDASALLRLAEMRAKAGDRPGAERLYRQVAGTGSPYALDTLARRVEKAGDLQAAERLYQQAADAGDTAALRRLAAMRERAGDRDGAERIAWNAAGAGDTFVLWRLFEMRERAGDRDGAERLACQTAAAGHPVALRRLAEMRERAGDRDGAERIARQAVDAGDEFALVKLARLRQELGDRDGAERLYQQVGDAGRFGALAGLAEMRQEAGDRDGAERLHRQAVDAGSIGSLLRLAGIRQEAGDRHGALEVVRMAADKQTLQSSLDSSLMLRMQKFGARPTSETAQGTSADVIDVTRAVQVAPVYCLDVGSYSRSTRVSPTAMPRSFLRSSWVRDPSTMGRKKRGQLLSSCVVLTGFPLL
nr:sel1 repeat family protein [Nonomuraea aurantiaca]